MKRFENSHPMDKLSGLHHKRVMIEKYGLHPKIIGISGGIKGHALFTVKPPKTEKEKKAETMAKIDSGLSEFDASVIIETLPEFSEANRMAIIKRMLKKGYAKAIVDAFGKLGLSGKKHEEVLLMMLEAEDTAALVSGVEGTNILSEETAGNLNREKEYDFIIRNIDFFEPDALYLIASHFSFYEERVDYVARNLKMLIGNKKAETVLSNLVEHGHAKAVADILEPKTMEKWYPTKLAIGLIKAGHASAVKRKLGCFDHYSYKLAEELYLAGEGLFVERHREMFEGVEMEDIYKFNVWENAYSHAERERKWREGNG